MTGVGLVSCVGVGTEQTWESIRNGRGGIAKITSFDATAFNSQMAGEVRDFDPSVWIEKKEIKKMGRFIHFGIAAADIAMTMSALKVTPETAENVGVYIGSGIGGFEVIEREHKNLLEKGPGGSLPSLSPRRS